MYSPRWISGLFACAVLTACGAPAGDDAGSNASDGAHDATAGDAHTDVGPRGDAPLTDTGPLDVASPDVPTVSDVPMASDVLADTVVVRDTSVPPDTGPMCTTGQTDCAGHCTNTQTDAANCGACGHVCVAGQTCSAGACMGGVSGCPAAPAGISANALAAYNRENSVRVAMGIPCAAMVVTANTSATRHCNYYVNDHATASCIANPHVEVSTCGMYVAAQFWDRMRAAGYTGSAAFEDMHFVNDGTTAVQGWIDSIWHRTPVLSPWVRDIGYGGAASGTSVRCDTMDFGTGATTPGTVVAFYPYANQTGVPTSFDGRYEGPMPPAPPSGWPSGYPITVYSHGGSITTHVLTLEGGTAPIAHVWLSPTDSRAMGLLTDTYVLYANAPLTPSTRYHVHIAGTNAAGAVTHDWTFTTGTF